MKIAQRLTLSLLTFSLAPLVISGFLVFSSMRFYISDQVQRQLIAFADQKEQQLYQAANNKLEELTSYTNSLTLQILLTDYLEEETNANRKRITDFLVLEKQKNRNLNNLYVLAENGDVIATTNTFTIRPNWADQPFFETAKTASTTTFVKSEGEVVPQLLLAGPISTQDRLLGIVVTDTDASDILLITQGADQLGDTAESFLVNKDGVITPLRQNNIPIAEDSLLTNSDKLVNERIRAVYPDAIDYRGERIIGVTRFIDIFNVSLITKIDRNEAYLPIFEIFIILSTISLIILILAIVSAYLLGQSISSPILRLALAASEVEKGNLNIRVTEGSKDEFGILANTFNDMVESIQKADQIKREFISLASHQLRTPLSSIKWFTELLLDKKSNLAQKQKSYLLSIQDSTIRMTSLINSLLDISRIEGNKIKLKLQPVDLKLLVEDVISDLEPKILEKKLTLITHLQSLPKQNLDIQLISEVYRNLILNSIKYTPPKGTITITISSEDHHILTKIKDTGVGIAQKDYRRVFAKFFRGKNAVAIDPEGSGLGLFLVKTIIDSIGGKIWFESKLGKGTTFYFTLPRTNPSQPKT